MALMVTVERLGQAAETFFLLDSAGERIQDSEGNFLEFFPQTPSS